MRLSADGRVDFINLFDKQLSWRAAAGWRILPKLVVKVIGGRAFQTPSTVFLYAHGGFGTADIIGSRVIIGPQLVPQVVTSYELVVNYLLGDNLVINAAGYLQSIENQITFLPNGQGFTARNQGTADSYGGELNITRRASGASSLTRASACKSSATTRAGTSSTPARSCRPHWSPRSGPWPACAPRSPTRT